MARSSASLLWQNVRYLIKEKENWRTFSFLVINVFITLLLLVWCHDTGSMALTAFTHLTIFDMFYLLTCLLTSWVRKQRASSSFTFGYERFEVLAVFACTMLAQLGAYFVLKESVEHLFRGHSHIHTSRLLPATGTALAYHLLVMCAVRNSAFDHVVRASASSWLQEHAADMFSSACSVLPALSRWYGPRINPFLLLGAADALVLLFTDLSIHHYNYMATDTISSALLAFMTIGTMMPMSIYTGKILLQTTPGHMLGQLDKCLRETSTLDGVLEFRNEHFWTLSFGVMAGTLDVRVRRDADQQLVLSHVTHRLSALVADLTVHIFKDDWSRPTAYQILGEYRAAPQGAAGLRRSFSPALGASGQPSVPAPVPDLLAQVTPQSVAQGHGHSH